MKTDKELYKLFKAYPPYLFDCAEIKTSETYHMKSVTFKEFEQRSDGFLESSSDNAPVYLAEFQAYPDESVYHRLAIEMASYGKENPKKDIRGILVFTTPNLDPKTSPWYELTKSEKDVLKVVYLQDVLDKLEKKQPEHPLVAVLKPWRIGNIDILKADAGKWYRNIKKSDLDEHIRENLTEVFTRWMLERFKDMDYEEVIKMFVELTPLEETRAYKEIFGKGALEGEKRGETKGKLKAVKDEIERLSLMRSQNILTESIFELLVRPLKKELKYLEALLIKNSYEKI